MIVLSASLAFAQGVQHSDVLFSYGAASIEVQPQNGRMVIPQIFPVSGFFAQANANPGFFSETDLGGGIGSNDIVGYNVLDDLLYWSAGEFIEPVEGTEIRVVNNPRSEVDDTLVGVDTGEQRAFFDPLINSIGQSNDSGEFHAHVDFRLEPISSAPEDMPAFGAYGLKLSLSSDNLLVRESDPFFVVYQFGIDDDLFTEALDDFDALLNGAAGITGDFDADGLLTATDIDLLTGAVTNATNSAAMDLTGDGLVDDADRTFWVEQLAGTFFGDANLNGTVGFPDFLALSGNFNSEGGWAEGDFNGNGTIGFPDFLTMSGNFGRTTEAVAVPEPAGHTFALTLLLGVLFLRRNASLRCTRG